MDSSTAAARERITSVVHRVVGILAPRLDPALNHPAPEPVDPSDVPLLDLGFNSLRLVEFAFMLEELFDMDPAAMGEAPPVGSVTDVVAFLLDKVHAGEAQIPDDERLELFLVLERERHVG